MKHTIIILVVILITGCNPGKWHLGGTDIFVLVDISDPHTLKPEFSSVRNLYDMRSNPCKSAGFKLTFIGDKNYMPEYDYSLENRPEGEHDNRYDDPQYRKKRIISFFNTIHEAIATANSYATEEQPLDQSECYRSIAHALTELSKRNSRKKYLLIYSDVTENSSVFQGYKDIEGDAVDNRQAIEYIKKRFEKKDLLPRSLKGIKVYFIFEPTSANADKRFTVFTMVYRELLESRGATVYIKSTNHITNENNE